MSDNMSPQEIAQKYARNVQNSTEDYRRGVERVQEAPGQRAARKQDKMRQNILAALDSGRWAERVSSVSLEQWKQNTIDKGVARLGAGAAAAQDKVAAFHAEAQPVRRELSNRIQDMPDLTLDDSVARAEAWMRGMREFKNRRRTR